MTSNSPKTNPSAARAATIAVQVLAGAALLLGFAFAFWAMLAALDAMAREAAAAFGLSPASENYARLNNSADLWHGGAMVLMSVMAAGSVVMAAFAAFQALVAFRAWISPRRKA